jgi:DNA ligase-1
MTATDMHHGRDWAGEDISGWYASEKLDGVRAYWDGSTLWTRQGNPIEMPERIRADLPAFHVDCEIWGGRGTFGDACAAAKGNWRPGVRLVVHDVPQAAGDWLARMTSVIFSAGLPAVGVRVIGDTESAMVMAAEIIRGGGEGIVVRKPGINYRPGRGTSTLKLKANCMPALRAMVDSAA